MSSKASILILLVIIGLSVCESKSISNENLGTEDFDATINISIHKMVPKDLDYKSALKLKIDHRNNEPEEYQKMNDLLQPKVLSPREIALKDLISILVDIFYLNLSYEAKLYLDINRAKVDENMREDYRNLTALLEEEIMDYIVPVNFLEVFSSKNNLRSIAVSRNFIINYADKMKEMDEKNIIEAFRFIMSLPKLYCQKMGYSMDNFIHLIETLFVNPERKYKENDRVRNSYQRLFEKFARTIKEDAKRGTFPNKSWSTLMKTLLSEVPMDLRKEFFSVYWKKDIDVKVLDLFKNLGVMYRINLFTLDNLDIHEDQSFEEYSRCSRCQRIVLESILKSMEKFLGQYFQRKDMHEEL